MDIFSAIVIILIGIFVVINFFMFVMSFGYVWEEKHPGHKDFMDILADFYKIFWRKIIK